MVSGNPASGYPRFYLYLGFHIHCTKMRIVFLLSMILLTMNACNQQRDSTDDAYLREFVKWKERRIARLKSENGWLNLAGLFWLEEGINTIGSDSSTRGSSPAQGYSVRGDMLEAYRRWRRTQCEYMAGDYSSGAP